MISLTIDGKTVVFEGVEERVVREVILEPGLSVLVDSIELFGDDGMAEVGLNVRVGKTEVDSIVGKFGELSIAPDVFPFDELGPLHL